MLGFTGIANETTKFVLHRFCFKVVASISDVKFSTDGRYILGRDYMTLKLWDINMDSAPVATMDVHEHIRPKLCDLYENDAIFDKFECVLSGDGMTTWHMLSAYVKLENLKFQV